MAELELQLDLFAQPVLVCSGCGRDETEAPAYVVNDLGRFCLDCEELAFRWEPEDAGAGTTPRLISSSGPNVAGGPDHSKPWRNPAVDAGAVIPSGAPRRGRAAPPAAPPTAGDEADQR